MLRALSIVVEPENKYRLLSNLNQTINQICKALKRINTNIWLRSGNSLHQREKTTLGQLSPGNQL
jgi:hypothetical protein